MKIRKFLFLSAALLVVVFCACSSAPKVNPAAWGSLGLPADPVPIMENVRAGTLPSGMRYFILENSMPENRAYLTLAVKAGSLQEEEDERGLAHFVEHMAFNGTARFPGAELVNYLRSLGMRFGPEVNAYVTYDRTVYGIEVPVEVDANGTKVIPDTALAVIDDWSRAVTFDPDEVEKERLVIIEEYRSRLGAWDRIRQQWLPVFFRGSLYADRNPIGQLPVIENATSVQLNNFFQKWYQADNMALIFVGDFDGAALEASLEDHFAIEKPADPAQLTLHDLPKPKKGIETLVLTDPELTGTTVYVYFRRSHEAMHSDLSYYRSELIDNLIEQMLTIRFNDELLKPGTPFVSAGARTERYAFSSRFYSMSAQAKSGAAEASLTELLRTKETMLRFGFTESEIALAKNSLISYTQRLAMESDRRQSERHVRDLTLHYVNGRNLPGYEWQLFAMQQLLPHITARDINAVIKDYFASGDIQVFIFAHDSELALLPRDAHIRQMVSQSGRLRVERPRDVIVEESFLASLPERGAVTTESVDTQTGAIIWELSNGAKVILKSTQNRNDEIILQAMARGGISSVSANDHVSASLAAEMVQVSGLGPFSLPELTRKLAGKQVSLSRSISNYYRGFQGSSTSGDLGTFFEILNVSFTDPRIDSQAVAAMLDRYATSLALRLENPSAVFNDEVSRTISGDHPRYKPWELADLSHANIDAALTFIRRGLNPADYTFVFTGNLDIFVMRNFVETYIASIPASESWNTWTDLNIVRPGRVYREVCKGKEEQSRVFMAWYTTVPSYSEESSIAAQLLREYLQIRVIEEIREKLGGVYSIGAQVSLTSIPRGEMSMRVSFGCDPGRVEELSSAVINLLNQTARTIDQDVFDKAVEAMHKSWETSMQSNTVIAQSYVNSSVLFNLPLSRLHERPQYINAVTPAEIQRICTQLLRDGPAQVVLFPE